MAEIVDVSERFDRKRRKDGLLFGLMTGLIYGLVSQLVNALAISGVTFYQPPFGTFGNILMWMAIGAMLGLVTSWPGGSLFGVLIGSLVAGLMLQTSVFFSGSLSRNLLPKVIGLIGFYVPFAALAVPLLGLLRLAANEEREWYDLPIYAWKRLRLPVVLVAVAGGIGIMSLYPPTGQVTIVRMNSMIHTGLQAGSPAALPQPLQDKLVGDFTHKATPDFNIALDTQNLTRYMIPYTQLGQFDPAAVIARFSNNWTLVCLYVNPNEDPFCRGYEDMEKEISIGQDSSTILDDHGNLAVPKP
jgi:hypothetical protein